MKANFLFMQKVMLVRERNVGQFAFFWEKRPIWDFDPGNYTGLPTSAIVKIVKCRRANVQKDTTSPAFIPRVALECESFIFVGAPP